MYKAPIDIYAIAAVAKLSDGLRKFSPCYRLATRFFARMLI